MSYKEPLASNTDFGIVKIGTGINVSGGIISTSSSDSSIGSWIPSIVSSLGATITLVTTNAKYSKVGQLVTCTFDISILIKTGGSNGGVLSLQGLPFTSIIEPLGGYVGSVFISYFVNMDSDTGWLTGSVVSNTKKADMFFGASQPKSLSLLTQNDIKPTTRLVGTITYISAT